MRLWKHSWNLAGTFRLFLLIGVLGAAGPVAAQSNLLQPYEARYEVLRNDSNYGEAIRTLTLTNKQYKLYTETEISLLFLSDRRRFWSEFVVNDNRIQTQLFTYKRTGTGRNKGFSGVFDWQQQQLLNQATQQPLSVDIAQHSMDEAANVEQLRIDVQQANKSDFVYQVIDEKGQADELRFRRVDEELLTLPYGEVRAIKVERVRENSKRETDYWFAPEMGYVLVKMAQRENGDEVATLQLSHIEQ